MFDPIIPARQLPARPNLEHLRGQAKMLLDAARSRDATALARLAALPHRTGAPPQLAHALLAIAREYGFASWPRLVAHVETLNAPADAAARREQLIKRFHAALHASDVDAMRTLLDTEPLAREYVDAPVLSFGGRPLGIAKRNEAMLDLLIEHGADVNARSDWWAGSWGLLDDADEATAKRLIDRGAIVDIFAAAHLNDLARMTELLDADPSLVHAKGGDGCRPLHFALTEAAIDLLLSRGAQIDARDIDHESTAAQWAMPRPPAERSEGTPPRAMQRVRWLVDRGASVDIFMAAALGDVARLTAILDADPSAISVRVNDKGYAPCPVGPGEHIYAYALVAGRSAHQIAHAAGHDDALRLLLERSTPQQRFLVACTTGDEAAARSALAAIPALLDSIPPGEQRALPDAAWAGDLVAVRLMLDLGFDPLTPGPDSGTALHCAAWHGRHEMVEMILNHPRVRSQRDRIVNAVETTHGGTPFGWCCHGSLHGRNANGDYAAVARLLIENGATFDAQKVEASPDVLAAIRGLVGR